MRSLHKLTLLGFVGASCLLSASLVSADNHGASHGGSGMNVQDVNITGSIQARGNWIDYDSAAQENSFVEQRTRLGVEADLGDDVGAKLEIDSYDTWGEDNRTDPLLGTDTAAVSSDDVEFYQAYVDFGSDVKLRVGRQEMQFGSEWLVGNNDNGLTFSGLSFDGLRLTMEEGDWTIDTFAMKVAEGFSDFGDNDTDFYGVYASYNWCDDSVLDAYWMMVRDDGNFAGGLGGTQADLHTIGLRAAGDRSGFDYDFEVAYQFGQADNAAGPGMDLDYGALGINAVAGYTFDTSVEPRVYFNFAYLPGNDGTDLAFSRMFSDYQYSQFELNNDFSNLMAFIWGATVMPADDVNVGLEIKYFAVEEEVGSDNDLGLELHLFGDYQYSEALALRAGWAWLDAGDALADGNAILASGQGALAGGADDNWNYLYIQSMLQF